jgi:hypothetical protein
MVDSSSRIRCVTAGLDQGTKPYCTQTGVDGLQPSSSMSEQTSKEAVIVFIILTTYISGEIGPHIRHGECVCSVCTLPSVCVWIVLVHYPVCVYG